MKRIFNLPILAPFLLGCLLPGPSFAEVVDKVVAVVNEEPITLYDLDKLMSEKIDEIKNMQGDRNKGKAFKDYRSMALRSLVDEKLFEQELKNRSIKVTEDDEEKAIKGILERNKLTQDQLMKELKAKGTTYQQYKQDLRSQLKKIKFMGRVIAPRVKVTDADLDEFFAKNSSKFANFQSVEMAQIILSLKVDADGVEIESAKRTAVEIIEKARGGDNFEELGKKYSVNPQTAVASVYQVQQLAPPLQQILSDMKPGDVSEPVRSTLGLHVIKLYQRKTLAGEEFKAIREQIRERVFEAKLQEELDKYLDDLRNQSYIEIKT